MRLVYVRNYVFMNVIDLRWRLAISPFTPCALVVVGDDPELNGEIGEVPLKDLPLNHHVTALMLVSGLSVDADRVNLRALTNALQASVTTFLGP